MAPLPIPVLRRGERALGGRGAAAGAAVGLAAAPARPAVRPAANPHEQMARDLANNPALVTRALQDAARRDRYRSLAGSVSPVGSLVLRPTEQRDLALAVARQATDAQLRQAATTPAGRAALRQMLMALNTGRVSREMTQQIERIGQHILPRHAPLLQETLPAAAADAVRRAGATLQATSDGHGPIGFDEFRVTIDRMPPGVTPEQFLQRLARDPNGTVNNGRFNLMNRFSLRNPQPGGPRVGDIYDIDILGPKNGAVVIRDMQPDSFTVATIRDPRMGEHPEYGVRQFGFERNRDGSITFFTRGVSRSASMIPGDNGALVSTPGRSLQQIDWTAMMRGIGETLQREGGRMRPSSVTSSTDPR